MIKQILFFHPQEINYLEPFVKTAHQLLHDKIAQGNQYLGWIDLPKNYDKREFSRIKSCADKIRSDSDILLVIGIGGSYLGARAAIEMLNHSFQNFFYRKKNVKRHKLSLLAIT